MVAMVDGSASFMSLTVVVVDADNFPPLRMHQETMG